jgi:hypothetical protein
MANGLYSKYKEHALKGDISWLTDDIKFVLVDAADYAVNLTAHEFLSDVPSVARVAISGNLAGKSATNGAADANDLTLTAVSGDISEALVGYKDTGTASTSPLICYIDTATGLAVTPNGGDISVVWPVGGIFNL